MYIRSGHSPITVSLLLQTLCYNLSHFLLFHCCSSWVTVVRQEVEFHPCIWYWDLFYIYILRKSLWLYHKSAEWPNGMLIMHRQFLMHFLNMIPLHWWHLTWAKAIGSKLVSAMGFQLFVIVEFILAYNIIHTKLIAIIMKLVTVTNSTKHTPRTLSQVVSLFYSVHTQYV